MAKHDVTVELFYNGQWNTAPAYVRDPVTIKQGRTGQEPEPATASLTLDNRTEQYNPRNPSSALYGVIGRNTPIRITVDEAVRFYGEVSSWAPRKSIEFDPVTGRGDAWTQVEAAGVLRRLGQGADPLASAARRAYTTAGPTAYWPLEDGQHATAAVSAVPGVADLKPLGVSQRQAPITGAPLPPAGLPRFAAGTGPGGSADLVSLTDGGLLAGGIPAASDSWEVHFVATLPANTDVSAFAEPMSWSTSGDFGSYSVTFFVDAVGMIVEEFRGAGAAGSLLAAATPYDGTAHHYRITGAQDGANIDVSVYQDGVLLGTVDDSGSPVPGVLGAVTGVEMNPGEDSGDQQPTAIGHVAVFSPALTDTEANQLVEATFGHPGETAGRRIERLCDENDVTFTSIGDLDATVAMGPQRVLPLLDLLAECERTDGGLLTDPVDSLGIHYRTRADLYNQVPALVLDATGEQIGPGLDPVVDDLDVANDVTATGPDDASAQVVKTSGPMSVQEPPDGIGRYSTTIDVNPENPNDLSALAAWRLAKGTVDEIRYPRITVDLDAAPELADEVAVTGPGDIMTIDNLEVDQVVQMVTSYTEAIGSHRRTVTYTTVPASPWMVGELEGDEDVRADTAGSELASSFQAGTDTSALVHTTAGARWINSTDHASHFPFEVVVSGARLQVTGVTHSETDAFGRTVASDWGTSESGFVWTRSGGSATDYSVASGTGRHSLGSVNVSRRTTGGSYTDCEIRVKVTIPVVAATDSIDAALMTRHSNSSNYYMVVLHCHNDGTVDVRVRKVTAGVFTTLLISHLVDGYTAGSQFWIANRTFGDTIQGKAWEVSRSEPPGWHAEATDTDHTSGAVGIRSNLQVNNTNTLPVVLEYDDFQIVDPQLFTVTQAPVNGVEKTISTGESVRLWKPWRAAL